MEELLSQLRKCLAASGRQKFMVAVLTALVGGVVLVAVSSADVIKNNIAGASAPGQKASALPGGSIAYDYWVESTGGTCDAADSTPLTLTIPASTPTGVTSDPSEFTVTECGTRYTVMFTVPESAVPGDRFTIGNVGYEDAAGQYSAGSTTFFIDVAASDGLGGPDTEPVQPTADAGGPYEGAEGGAPIEITGAVSDADSFAWSVVGDAGNDTGAECVIADETTLTPALNCNEDGLYSLTLTAVNAAGQDESTVAVTVSNVAPSMSAITVSNNACVTAIDAVSFADAGAIDTHVATINWGDGTEDTVDPAANGFVPLSHTYAVGGEYIVTVTVTDDEDAEDKKSENVDNRPVVGAGDYPIPPIMVGKTFKVGSTIPVKIRVSGCTTGLNPVLSVTPNVLVKASGKSNLADAMRYTSALPGFIYNLNTKGWALGSYTFTISGLGDPISYSGVTFTK